MKRFNAFWVLVAAVFATGAAALIYEVVWIKLLVLAFGSTAQSLAVVTSIFFLGMAAGAMLAARFVDRLKRPNRWLGDDPGPWSLLALKALLALAILSVNLFFVRDCQNLSIFPVSALKTS